MIKIAELDEVPVGNSKLVIIDDIPIALFNINGKIIAWDNRCPHRGAALYYGRNEECGIRCVYHGWKFASNGNCVDLPTAPKDSNFKEKIRVIFR